MLSGDQTIDAPAFASTSKSFFWSATQWIPASELVTAQSPFGPWSARKCARALSSVPSLRCRSRQSRLSRRFRNFVAVLGLDVGDVRGRFGKVVLVRLLDVPDDPLVEALDAGVAGERDSLSGRRPGDEALGLDVANDRRHVLGRVREHLHRAGDELPVRVALGPLVAVRVQLRHVPELERVVAQVVVEVDQARVDRALGLENLDALEPGRRIHGRLLHRDDRAGAHVDDSVRRRPSRGRPWSRRGRRARTSGRRAGRPGCRGTRSTVRRVPDQRVAVVGGRTGHRVVVPRMALPAGGVVAEEVGHAERQVAPRDRRVVGLL